MLLSKTLYGYAQLLNISEITNLTFVVAKLDCLILGDGVAKNAFEWQRGWGILNNQFETFHRLT